MKTLRVPLVSTIESRTESIAKDSRLVNCLCETRGDQKELVKRPGLITAAITPTLPAQQANGLFPGLGLLWADINGTLYGITPGGSSSSFGSIGAGSPYLTSFAQTTVVATSSGATLNYTTPGTYSFVVPASVTSINTVIVGAAGGGGGGAGASGGGGGGGHAGVITSTAIVVTPGATVTITVGAAGTGGAGGGDTPGGSVAGTAGGSSSVGATVSAGGAGGAAGLYNGSSGPGSPGDAGFTGVGGYPTAGTGAGDGSGNTGGAGGSGYGAGGGGGHSAPIGNIAGRGGAGTNGFVQISYSPVISTSNPVNTLIHNGFSGFYVSAGAGAVSQVWNAAAPFNGFFPQGPLATGAVYLDGYIFVMTTAGRIYNCQPNDPTSWNAINFISASTDPGNGVALARHFNYVVAFSQWSTNFFYDAGNATGSPLSPYQAASFNIGCASGGTVAGSEETVFWVGQSKLQGKSVYMLEGLTPIRISTRYIEKYLNADPLSDIRAYCMKLSGHTLYVLTLHTNDLFTFVYDVEEKLWYQWTTTISGVEHYFRPAFFAQFNNQYFLLDDDNGTMYHIDPNVYQDVSNVITCRAVTNYIDFDTTMRKFYRAARLVGDTVSSTATLSFTDDDYQTYSTGRTIDLSVKRPQLYQMGASRRRAWQLVHTANTPLRLRALEIDADIGDT